MGESSPANTHVAAASAPTAGTLTGATASSNQQATIELYAGNPEENTPFKVGNMLPGDSETKSFRVRVSHSGAVTVYCAVSARPGYEKLAEVMQVRIALPATGEVVYDGLLRDASDVPARELTSAGSTAADELQYEITAYLDTSVGNEYQNLDLIADIDWWVDDAGALAPSAGDGLPTALAGVLAKTGDLAPALAGAILVAAVAALAIFVASRKRRGGDRRG